MFDDIKNKLRPDSEALRDLEKLERDEKELFKMAATSDNLIDKLYIYSAIVYGRTRLFCVFYNKQIRLFIYALLTALIIYNFSKIL